MHPNLRTAGTLPSLDMPHHLRANEWCEYREGVTGHSTNANGSGSGTLVDVGLPEYLEVSEEIPPGTRVTLRLHDQHSTTAETVAPSAPREEKGYYWGYAVRQCTSLSSVFTECPFDGGYDVSIGTSERGAPLSDVLTSPVFSKPTFTHVLVVFGGVAGLEKAARNDSQLQTMGISENNVNDLFDAWVNVLPGQGSRTIRTEEAVWLGLMGLRTCTEQLG